jgi:hypothetical protein
MSATTVRKLGRISDGANTSYFLMPPKFWLDSVEKTKGKKILHFSIMTEEETLILTPVFENPKVEPPRNSSPELIAQMLRQGKLLSKLREIRKGKNVYRIVNVPRSWIRTREQEHNRKVNALRFTTEQTSIRVEPVFGDKLKES